MTDITTNIHVRAKDRICASSGDTVQWLWVGGATIFADTADLERIKAAIDDLIAMRTPQAEAA